MKETTAQTALRGLVLLATCKLNKRVERLLILELTRRFPNPAEPQSQYTIENNTVAACQFGKVGRVNSAALGGGSARGIQAAREDIDSKQ